MNSEQQQTSNEMEAFNCSTDDTKQHHHQQQEPSSLSYSPQSYYPLPQPSPLHRRSISSVGRCLTNNYDTSPLLIRRRALSCTDGEAAQQQQYTSNYNQRQSNSTGNSSQPYCLPTIHSRCEMDDNNISNENHTSEGRNNLYATPTRKTQNNRSHNRRTRAASSSDIVINISSDNLPRYDDELASCIDSISDGDVYEHEQLFATPERSSNNNNRNSPSRDRANTCPHRPQQHSMFEFDYDGMEGDEESGHQFNLELAERSFSEQRPSHDGFLSRAFTPERRGGSISLNDSYSSSPERRSHSASSIPPSAPAVPNLRMPASLVSPRSSRRPSSAPTTTHRERSASITTIPSSPASINRLSRTPPSSSSTSNTPIPLTATQRAHATAQNFVFRINPHVMKVLMTLSLYMLLAYTWNTDLLINRAKSMEINYGLSEYWSGAEKIGRVSTDDEGGGVVTKLLINGKLDSSSSRSGDAAVSGDGSGSPSQDDVTTSFSIMDIEKGKVRRPNLSYARSIDGKLTTYGVNSNQRRAMMSVARKNSSSSKYEWTFSRLAWAFVWLGFMVPIVEMGIREIRRQINIRFWNVRRLRPLRAIPSRVYVHNS